MLSGVMGSEPPAACWAAWVAGALLAKAISSHQPVIAVTDSLLRDLGINLSGIEVGVAKQLLDHHNIHSGVKRAGGKSMPEFMGMQRS